jgi:hypothetical protein
MLNSNLFTSQYNQVTLSKKIVSFNVDGKSPPLSIQYQIMNTLIFAGKRDLVSIINSKKSSKPVNNKRGAVKIDLVRFWFKNTLQYFHLRAFICDKIVWYNGTIELL